MERINLNKLEIDDSSAILYYSIRTEDSYDIPIIKEKDAHIIPVKELISIKQQKPRIENGDLEENKIPPNYINYKKFKANIAPESLLIYDPEEMQSLPEEKSPKIEAPQNQSSGSEDSSEEHKDPQLPENTNNDEISISERLRTRTPSDITRAAHGCSNIIEIFNSIPNQVANLNCFQKLFSCFFSIDSLWNSYDKLAKSKYSDFTLNTIVRSLRMFIFLDILINFYNLNGTI